MLYQKISDDLKEAMKAKDKKRLSVLRMIKSKIMTENPRGDLPDEKIIDIIKKYNKTLKESLEQSQKAGREDEVREIEEEMKVVQEYLPKMLSEEEVENLVQSIIKEHGYTDKSDMGKVMKELMSKSKNIDGNTAKNIVLKELS